MAARLGITIACDDFEIVRPLKEGTVKADGLDLVFVGGNTNPERHRLMVRELAFDVCELNVTTYLIARENGVPITSFPVFLFRKFRHSSIYVNRRSGIVSPRQLAGQRIGCPNMQAASNVWARGHLTECYDTSCRDMIWMAETEEEIEFERPSWMKVEPITDGRSAGAMLLDEDVMAVISPLPPAEMDQPNSSIVRLFEDSRVEEQRYFERTGIFPIMHVTAIKQDLAAKHPWIPLSLQKAFESAKRMAYKRMANVRLIPLVWFGSEWERQHSVFGDDPWEYGWSGANRLNIETAIRFTRDQGLIKRAPSIEEAFVCP